MTSQPIARISLLSAALFGAIAAAQAQEATGQAQSRATESSTSNTTSAYDTKRVQELDKIDVTAKSPVLGGGSMMVQTAPKAISTVTREAIQEEAGGSNFTQLIDSIPGVDASTDDPSGLSNGNYSLRGFDASSIGITVNGAPITDTGSYSVYGTQYGDAENYNDITVMQGTPNVDMPDMGASGGHIAWSTIDPTHDFGVDFRQSFGSYDYQRSFVRVNTGDTGPIRSWISYSTNSKDKWKGDGKLDVTKIDGKSLWQINDENSISFSFQYSRQQNARYRNATKAQIQSDYDYDQTSPDNSYGAWPTSYTGYGSTSYSAGTYYSKLARNPYKNIMVSADGEFTFTDNLRLSVVPYYYYGNGGSGYGYGIREGYYSAADKAAQADRYGYAWTDLNDDGLLPTVSKSTYANSNYYMTYLFSHNRSVRPGVVAKFIQNIGLDHTLSYGVWLERSQQQNWADLSKVNQETGDPCDVWADSDSCLVTYQDGKSMQSYRTYAKTTVQKYFIQDYWTPTDKLTVNLGASWIHATREGHSYEYPGADAGATSKQELATFFDQSYSKLSPALGVKYQLDDQNQFFYGVAKTFRIPKTNAIVFNQAAGISDSKPEEALTHDLGWRYYGDRYGMAALAYQSDYKNKQMYGYDQDTGLDTYIWIPKVRMRGVNWEGSVAFSQHWKGYLSYTYTEAEVRTKGLIDTGDDGAYPLYGKQLVNTPKNIASARISWSNGEFWASLKARYSGERYGDYMNTEKVGGYTQLSFNGGVNLPDIGFIKKPELKLNIFNLLDRKAYTYATTTQWVTQQGKAEAVAEGVSGASDWYYGTPYYGVLAPRTIAVTFGGSF
jgi:iron complex outermembrane receptor protein